MVYVIGSGPAGLAVTVSLLDQGVEVTMLDAGVELEPERRAIVDRMQSGPAIDWAASDIAAVREGMEPTSSGVPLKRVYGSDYPYREASRFVPIETEGVDSAVSFARGGFSNVWGSAMLPYTDRDLQAWPIRAADLAPHYRSVLEFVPIAGIDDDLARTFPLYTDAPKTLAPSSQTMALLADLERCRSRLGASGVSFGRSRLAVTDLSAEANACVYCGLCMYGCPHELIYSTSHTLTNLTARSGFRYVPGVVVESIEERSGTVRIHARDLASGSEQTLDGERAYVACGPVASPRLLMRSLEMYDTPVRLLDSQYFLFPLLRLAAPPDVASEALHTLAQAFIEIDDPEISPDTVHLQLYSYNAMYDETFRTMLGRMHTLLRIPVAAIVARMFIVQGYLHSNVSPAIELTLARDAGSPAVLHMRAIPASEPPARTVSRVTRRLLALRDAFRAAPITPMLKIAQPGRGFHTGGSFPMRDAPSSATDTDTLGRPRGFSRVHVVDATVFPSIPATTITLSVMANAHRIGARYHDT